MLSAPPTQFKLSDAGEVLYQPVPNNPVPGAPVAQVVKGAGPLQPAIEVPEGSPPETKAFLENWLKGHIVQVLEPLIALLDEPEGEEIKPYVKELIARVFKAMGIIPREELEDLIAQLDTDDRRVLRSKKIRLGPILVFIPDLNKPAAVRMRALLWSLYNDKKEPGKIPPDGVVSMKVEPEAVDKTFYQSIGYPVYGSRAIRIDMLDRVINAIYDSAEGGKFQAQHQMAEWLGCGIEDLYGILSAMGHKKGHDPADDVKVEEEATKEPAAEDAKAEVSEIKAEDAPKEEPQKKPELATFFLKKGKAFEKKEPRASKPAYKKADKPQGKSDKKFDKKKGKRNKSASREPKVMSFEAEKKPEDNPFAVLAQLKDGGNAS